MIIFWATLWVLLSVVLALAGGLALTRLRERHKTPYRTFAEQLDELDACGEHLIDPFAELDKLLAETHRAAVVAQLPDSVRDDFTAAALPCGRAEHHIHQWVDHRMWNYYYEDYTGGWKCKTSCGAETSSEERVEADRKREEQWRRDNMAAILASETPLPDWAPNHTADPKYTYDEVVNGAGQVVARYYH